jgi:site-specific recombinase XerD
VQRSLIHDVKAGLDKSIVLYEVRHMFDTTYLEHGGNMATLMTIMGHESIASTSKYRHGDMEGAAKVIDRRNNKACLTLVKGA